MMKDLKSLWSGLISGLAAMALVVAVGCGDDDNDDSAGGTGGGGSGGATGGSGGATGGSGGATGGSGGATGGTGGTEGTVEEGGDCTVGMLGAGKCAQPTAACEGGTADLVAAGLEGLGLPPSLLGGMADPRGNCVEGLVCCIGTDQCASLNDQLEGMTGGLTTLSCMAESGCAGTAFAVGCPSGSVCCMETNIPDAGPRDGGAGSGAGMGGTDGGAAGTGGSAAGTGGSAAGTGGTPAVDAGGP